LCPFFPSKRVMALVKARHHIERERVEKITPPMTAMAMGFAAFGARPHGKGGRNGAAMVATEVIKMAADVMDRPSGAGPCPDERLPFFPSPVGEINSRIEFFYDPMRRIAR